MFLEVSQNSQKTPVPKHATLLKRDSGTDLFL